MKFLKILVFFSIVFQGISASAQYAEKIRSGRPGLSIGPFTVGKSVIQNQTGFYNTYDKIGQDSVRETNGNYLISIFRIGFTETFELGLGLSYAGFNTESSTSDTVFGSSSREGINLLTLALRSNIYDGKGAIPSIGYQVNFNFPYLSKDFERDYVFPRITLMTHQRFGKVHFLTNWSAVWNGFDANPSGIYTLFLAYDVSEKIRVFVEHYALVTDTRYRPSFDLGLTYLLNNDLQLDLQYGNTPEKDFESAYFITLGVGWRTKWKKS